MAVSIIICVLLHKLGGVRQSENQFSQPTARQTTKELKRSLPTNEELSKGLHIIIYRIKKC